MPERGVKNARLLRAVESCPRYRLRGLIGDGADEQGSGVLLEPVGNDGRGKCLPNHPSQRLGIVCGLFRFVLSGHVWRQSNGLSINPFTDHF